MYEVDYLYPRGKAKEQKRPKNGAHDIEQVTI